MLNNVVLIGRLVRDPELRFTSGGVAICNFTLAVDRPYKNQAGEQEADFIDIRIWRKLAETCANHLGKGRLVAVEGSITTQSYDDKDGNRRKWVGVTAHNVRFLDWPKDGQKGSGGMAGASSPEAGDVGQFGDDIDVPF